VGGLEAILERAGKAALRAVVPLALVLGYGLVNAKNLNDIRTSATIFAVGVLIVAVTTLQALVPQLSWRYFVAETYAKYLDAATQAFLGTFLALIAGFLAAPNWDTWQSVVTGALVAGGTAVIRAIQALLTPGEPVLDSKKEPKMTPRSVLTTTPAVA
jgi:hypothetical protein